MKNVKFILLASQRTGSNLLNSTLNTYNEILCHGEVFNPSFVGLEPSYHEILGVSRDDVELRDSNHIDFLNSIWLSSRKKITGFHLFPNHSNTIFDYMLKEYGVKKVFLRRSLFQSFVSLQIALKTDVWRISANKSDTNERVQKQRMKVVFDSKDFERYELELDSFWNKVFNSESFLSESGFSIWYSELKDIKRINELACFLGSSEVKPDLSFATAQQNPSSLQEKVINWEFLKEYAKERGLEHHLY